jgi:hypothetical protein
MRMTAMSAARLLVVAACAALLALTMALPAAGAQQQARDGHSLVKKLPKKWLKAHKLAGKSAKPLADPDRDGACNWVEFRQHTNPRRANEVTTAPPTTAVPASRLILLEGSVAATTPTGFTLTLDSGLIVNVSLPSTAPVVDGQGLTTALAAGQAVHAFVTQTSSDLALSAVLVLVDDNPAGDPGDPRDDDGDNGDHHGGGDHRGGDDG